MSPRSRAERLERVRGKRKRVYVLAATAAVAVLVIAGVVAFATLGPRPGADQSRVDVAALDAASEPTTALASSIASGQVEVLVEVPSVTGWDLADAQQLLDVAGLTVALVSTPPGDAATGTVLAQSPEAGERVVSGTLIEIVWADPEATTNGISLALAGTGAGPVVCIDPGHQSVANSGLEPIGPGATETKPKVTGGGAGVVTRQAEYELNLALSLEIKERLEARGVTVVMTRTANEVDISNSQRATIANEAGADLFLRIHADSSTNADLRGISTLYAGGNAWVRPIEAESRAAAEVVHASVLRATDAEDRGVMMRSDLSGFNWSTVPAVLVETGFLSNPVDDRALADATYRDTLAEGIAQGVLDYLGL